MHCLHDVYAVCSINISMALRPNGLTKVLSQPVIIVMTVSTGPVGWVSTGPLFGRRSMNIQYQP